MAGVLIDTSVIVDHLRSRRRKPTSLQRLLRQYRDGGCYISAITVFEVEYGSARAGRESDLAPILPSVRIIPFGRAEAEAAARLQAQLISENAQIGYRDLFLAGTCLAHGLPIATKNWEHFERVSGLKVIKA